MWLDFLMYSLQKYHWLNLRNLSTDGQGAHLVFKRYDHWLELWNVKFNFTFLSHTVRQSLCYLQRRPYSKCCYKSFDAKGDEPNRTNSRPVDMSIWFAYFFSKTSSYCNLQFNLFCSHLILSSLPLSFPDQQNRHWIELHTTHSRHTHHSTKTSWPPKVLYSSEQISLPSIEQARELDSGRWLSWRRKPYLESKSAGSVTQRSTLQHSVSLKPPPTAAWAE